MAVVAPVVLASAAVSAPVAAERAPSQTEPANPEGRSASHEPTSEQQLDSRADAKRNVASIPAYMHGRRKSLSLAALENDGTVLSLMSRRRSGVPAVFMESTEHTMWNEPPKPIEALHSASEPKGVAKPMPKIAGSLDATLRRRSPVDKNVSEMFANATADVEATAPVAKPAGPRKSYAGTVGADGKFQKTKAASLQDLTEEEKQEVLEDIEIERQRKIEELKRRQKKHDSTKKNDKQRQFAELHDGEEVTARFRNEDGPKKATDLRTWLSKKDEDSRMQHQKQAQAMAAVLAKARQQQAETEELALERAETREKRLRIGERKREGLRQQMVATGQQHNVTQEMFPKQRMLHRHIHHHMHYHGGGGDGPPGVGVVTKVTHTSEHMGPGSSTGLRRVASDVVFGGAQGKGVDKMGQSASVGDLGKAGTYKSSFQVAAGSYAGPPRSGLRLVGRA